MLLITSLYGHTVDQVKVICKILQADQLAVKMRSPPDTSSAHTHTHKTYTAARKLTYIKGKSFLFVFLLLGGENDFIIMDDRVRKKTVVWTQI